jgi:hypothetical protein
MRQERTKSGVSINVLGEGESPVVGQVNFQENELAWARKISKSTSDPDAEKEFWKSVFEKKMENFSYSVFDDFPEGSGEETGPSPTSHSPSPERAPNDHSKRRAFNGAAICADIQDMLRGRGARTKREREGEAS